MAEQQATPADRLEEARAAFEAGDFAAVRRICRPLADADVPEVAGAARTLLRRVGVDPVQIVVVAACLALFVVIAAIYV